MDSRSSRRQIKRSINWFRKHCGYGKFVINCYGHPSKVVKHYFKDMAISTISLLDDSGCGCSFLHCAPLAIPEQFARSLKEPWYHWDEIPDLKYKKYRELNHETSKNEKSKEGNQRNQR